MEVENLQLLIDDEPVVLDANGVATVSVLVLDPSGTVGSQVSLDISHIEDGVITAHNKSG